MGSLRLLSVVLVVLLAIPVPSLAQGSARIIYCCDDTRGRPVCGDILPAACYGQAYREISPQGTVRRHVAAPLTAEEIARRDAEERRRREEAARLAIQQRLDDALLETYKDLTDIDMREERALAEIERSVVDIRRRVRELTKQRLRFESEAEFYEGRALPRDVASGLRIIDAELEAYRSVIELREAEKDAIRTRYAADRRRYAELIAAGVERR